MRAEPSVLCREGKLTTLSLEDADITASGACWFLWLAKIILACSALRLINVKNG